MKYKYFVKYKGKDFETRGYYSDGETYEDVTLLNNGVYSVSDVRGQEYVCTADFLSVIPVTCSFFKDNFEVV